MKKLTKLLFAGFLAMAVAPAAVLSLTSAKSPTPVRAAGQYDVGFAIKEHLDVYFEETGNNKVQNTKTGVDGKLVHLPELYRTDTLDYSFDGWFIQNTDTRVTLDTVFDSDATLVDRWTYTSFDVDHKVSSIKINNPTLSLGTKQGEYTASAPTVNVDGVTGGTSFTLYKGLNKSGDALVGDEEVEIGKNYSAVTTLTLKSGFKFDDQLFPTATNGLAADYKYRGNMWLTSWSTSATQIEVVINFVQSDDYYFTQQPESREFENYTEYHYWYALSDELNDGLIGVDLQYYENSEWYLFGPATMVVSPYANKTFMFRLVAKHEHGNVYCEPWTITWSVIDASIKSIHLGVNTPQNGEAPNYTAEKSDNRAAFAQINDSHTQNGVKWAGSASGDLTVGTSTFNNSEDYTVSVKLVAQEGYSFDISNLVAKVNARVAEISGDSEEVTISYTFEKAAQIKHKVYFYPSLHGSGTMDPAEVVEGAEYTLPDCTFTPDTNYKFAAWSVSGELKKPGDTIVVNSDEFVFATWQASSTPASYGFSVQPVGGSTAVGTYITIPFEVDSGINFDSVDVLAYDEQSENWNSLLLSRDLVLYEENGRIVSAGIAYDKVGAKLLRINAVREGLQVGLSDTFTVNWNAAEMTKQPVGATIIKGTSYTFTWKTNFDARFRILCFDGEDWSAIGATTNSFYTVVQETEKSLIYQVCADVPYTMSNGSTNYVFDVVVSQTFIVNWVEAASTEYIVNYAPGEGSGSSDMDYVTAGSVITLKTPQELGFAAPEGQVFDAWQINGVKYDAGDTYTVNADTYIIALWKDAPVVATGLSATYTGENIVVGNKINPANISITVTYSNETQSPVDPGDVEYWYQGVQILDPVNYIFESAGVYQITVKYLGLEATMNVTVIDPVAPKTLTGIEVTGTYKTEYTVGETFSTEGIVVKAVYSNGDKEDIALNEVTFSGYNMNQAGNQTVTATWNEYSTTFQIIVKEAPVDPEKTLVSITLSGNQKTEFTVGDTFSAEGLVVTAHYSDDSSETIDLNNVEISGYNMNQEGKQTVTVSYQGKTATYEITVKAKDTPITPDDPVTPNKSSGLPAGAVVGIVIGSALVVGVGGFALVWFVIKKKTWADFLALFKKK